MTMSPMQSRLLWLLAAVLSLGWGYAVHRFEPRMEADSPGYLDFDWSTPRSWLANQRTIGYPLLLRVVGWLSDRPQAIPLAHSLALVAASFVLLEGLAAAGYRRHTAFWCAAAVLFGRGVVKFGPSLVADSLASSCSIAATGCFLASLSARSWIPWIGLIGLTFLTYQIRPAYLFLIPLWPLVSLGADWLIVRRGAAWKLILSRAAVYACATIVPFVLFCTLRWAVVGHWGLVSFGGYNIIGVAGQFLEEDSVGRLSADLQPLATDLLRRRTSLAEYEPPTNFVAMEQMFNPTVWKLAVPAARDLYGDDTVAVNRGLARLGGELLHQHPDRYTRWLSWNAAAAFKEVLLLTVTDHGTLFLGLTFLACQLGWLWAGPRSASATTAASETLRFREWQLLFWTALAFTAAKCLLVMLVEPANERYMTGAMPLLPAALGVPLAQWIDSLATPRLSP